jgi:endoglucanase
MKRPTRSLCNLAAIGPALLLAACRPPAPATPAAVPATPTAPAKVSAAEAPRRGELLKRSHFADSRSLPWMPLYIEPARGDTAIDAGTGAMCLRVAASGKNPWDVQLRHREMTIKKGHSYTIAFKAWASTPTRMRAKVGMSGAPYREYYSYDGIELGPKPIRVEQTFTADEADDPTAEMAFHLGGELATAPNTVCFDDLHLVDPTYVAPPPRPAPAAPPVRVNQVGLFAAGPKRATWLTATRSPVPFELVDGAGHVVFSGRTQPAPRDPSSGDAVQLLDFSGYHGTGQHLRLRVAAVAGVAESDPFDVAERGVLAPLVRAALRYFYQNRSGVPLAQPFTEGAAWERAAGHPTDSEVPCAADAGCDYPLDVSGGWYDAGDYGKYVVNGGLSVWLLLNMWELSQAAGKNGVALTGLGDGALGIPESGNGRSDVLDEARFEIEWMLKMQVPEGKPHAGMAHHKIHDVAWTGLAVMPQLTADVKRALRPVSTAATLNLAAVAAQSARVFAPIDAAFARRCRRAAERAWRAAEAEPPRLVGPSDRSGGGAYDDDDVSDERYWAAAELFVTTGDGRYRSALDTSPFRDHITRRTLGAASTISWRATDALGMVSLILGPKVPRELKESRRRLIVEAADAYARDAAAAGFGQPLSGTVYPWGSNAVIVDNGMVLALAHWLTGERRYLDGAAGALDYVLGRNALGKSYVSGFGVRPLEQPHHRFWSHALDPRFPGPPPGALAGGPNTALEDPYARAALAGCVGQRCYVDNIEAPSLNEVAINWNAALAWLAAYVEAAMPAAL